MKRKAAEALQELNGNGHAQVKRPATEANGANDMRPRFASGLFSDETVKSYSSAYATSEPYRHAVVSGLINDDLLRSVRSEIVENIHFTPKETDIYKIHQSGDLANLDGLDPAALEKLPSLLKLRDALYSQDFRTWISRVSGAGPVSGRKTDMAVNLYVPGCHLLCHDDVIGSRRVSYILYLTDPDRPWQAEWGGALRLYATDKMKGEDGKMYKVPRSEWSKVIPPAWNQLSFFAVQPGESFHDVEEVYHPEVRCSDDSVHDGRFRMAISGWYHIPQEGEEGYEAGLEERMAEKSSLQQLQGKAEQFDEPQMHWQEPLALPGEEKQAEEDEGELTEAELDFLLRFMTPTYLTPETVDELNDMFAEESILQLSNFLGAKFADSLREELARRNASDSSANISRPPHKHRYQYSQLPNPVQPLSSSHREQNAYLAVFHELLPSLAFRKWLSLATGLTLKRCSILARRFRAGLDYQLAQGYEGEQPQLEFTLCMTSGKGWGGEEEDGGAEAEAQAEAEADVNGVAESGSKGKGKASVTEHGGVAENEEDNVGGYEVYMAGDDAEDEDEGQGGDDHDDGVPVPTNIQSSTGAGQRRQARSSKRDKADPAVYKSAATDEEDDGILFSNPASWNTLSVVLRDRGTLKFVKYVSKRAPGDRWDFTGAWEVEDGDEDEGEEVVDVIP
ncbi:hypothetical protein BAUCODRAFT_36731 [Baudoinia panamericana UAMH 10762]|uniref:uS12 prolyl 3,4-dihydroxylase n=1 Tax=Baudoinia panamericana (strain UAMH 10762) TaxID=717646 RepID=M2N5D9_BAUPA|nr:uncharacterized protein BAUCODRAFT_36731 [Baudoinia panamericana UAMH 10762]EMC94259.1 hypothetical protein BAUCODRAFT_36731 [Baudoinia panamericana UAMH 10762]